MYDPLVVDAFTKKWQSLTAIEQSSSKGEARGSAVRKVEELTPLPVDLDSNLVEPIGKLLDAALASTGARLAILFGVDSERDRLVSFTIRTPSGTPRRILTTPLGFGISGWVAVNGTPILNAEASLDFPDDPIGAGLVRSICVPLNLHGGARGVLSLYSDDPRGFSDDDKALVQKIAAQLANEKPSQTFSDLLRSPNKSNEAGRTVH
jgi:GAF domain-containing protein